MAEKTIDPWRFDVARNEAMKLIPPQADICVSTDLDEAFTPGWREALEAAWTDDATQARYRYTWNFLPDGSEGVVFWPDKIHRNGGFVWKHPVHEILSYQGPLPQKIVTCEGVQLDHRADRSKSRGQYLPLLELSVREDPDDDRNMHYLGREYFFYGRWKDCVETLKRHLSLPRATWADERCASMRYIAMALEHLGEMEEAERWFYRAVGEAPYLREPVGQPGAVPLSTAGLAWRGLYGPSRPTNPNPPRQLHQRRRSLGPAALGPRLHRAISPGAV